MRICIAVLSAALLAGSAAEVARAGVSDEIIMKSEKPGQKGMEIFGRILWVKDGKIRVVVNAGDAEGPVTWSMDRVARIQYDFDGRRAELPAGDHLARYKFALWVLSLGRKDEALFDLEAVVGKPGVPAAARFLLAKLQEELGELRKALKNYEAYLLKNPRHGETRAAIKRLKPKVAALPVETRPVVIKNDTPVGTAKPVKPVKPIKPTTPGVEEGLEIYPGGWRAVPWGNPAAVTKMKDDDTGNQFLAVQMSGKGRESKTAIELRVGRTKPAALKSAKLIFHVYNPHKKTLPISVAFSTVVKAKYSYFESRTSRFRQGWHTMTVDLNGKDFKSRETEWAYRTAVKGKDNLKSIIILINTRRKATIYLDYIKFKN